MYIDISISNLVIIYIDVGWVKRVIKMCDCLSELYLYDYSY